MVYGCKYLEDLGRKGKGGTETQPKRRMGAGENRLKKTPHKNSNNLDIRSRGGRRMTLALGGADNT